MKKEDKEDIIQRAFSKVKEFYEGTEIEMPKLYDGTLQYADVYEQKKFF